MQLTKYVLTHSEVATMSVFILAGNDLKAEVEISGPVASLDVVTGADLEDAVKKYDAGHFPKRHLRLSEMVDFEHLNVGAFEHEDLMITVPPEGEETHEQRQERRALERKKILENRQRKDQHNRNQKNKVRSEGEPFLSTIDAPVEGWYRFCVKANYDSVVAEIDVRKESELGGVDANGNVWTYRQKVMVEEDQLMDADTAALEGIKEEDFKGTREKLKQLRRLLGEIQQKQSQERHRIAVHSATNEHSHSRMALNSLMETILFMAVTGYQVYTIRRWFKGAPVLGR
jgi:hypothetical protein